MLSIKSRSVADVTFDAATETYRGLVRLSYTFHDDPDQVRLANLWVEVHRPYKARYAFIEAALFDAASDDLLQKFSALEEGPINIFAVPPVLQPLARVA